MEFARSLGDHATVLTGRCEPEAIVPFAPFVEILRGLVRSTPSSTLRPLLRSIDGSAELVQLLPELAKHVRSPRPPVVATPEGRRFRMFEALAEFLTATSQRTPLLVMLEDVHWADRGSMLLLRHLVRSTLAAAILFIITYREAALDDAASAGEILSELWREPSATRMALQGLADDHVRDLIAATIGPETPGWATRVVAAKAGGNPLFIIEMAKHLIETNVRSDAIPASQRDCEGAAERECRHGALARSTDTVGRTDLAHAAGEVGPVACPADTRPAPEGEGPPEARGDALIQSSRRIREWWPARSVSTSVSRSPTAAEFESHAPYSNREGPARLMPSGQRLGLPFADTGLTPHPLRSTARAILPPPRPRMAVTNVWRTADCRCLI